MSEFSKMHLNRIKQLRNMIEIDETYHKDYVKNKMFHKFVDWYCADPNIKNPTSTLILGRGIAFHGAEYGFDVSNPESFNWPEAIHELHLQITKKSAEEKKQNFTKYHKICTQAFDILTNFDFLGMYGGAEKVNKVFNELQMLYPEQQVILDNFRKE